MNKTTSSSPHWSFWVIGILALIWNAMSAANIVMQMDPEVLAGYSGAAQAVVEGRPMWATIAFAIAAFAGVLGSLLLLLRKGWAIHLFVLSFLGVIVQMIHSLGKIGSFGPPQIIGYLLMPLAVSVFLVWYAKRAQNKGWFG